MMDIKLNTTTIVGIISAIILFFFIRKRFKKTTGGTTSLAESFTNLVSVYGKDYMRRIEKLFRLETADFTSGGWTKTLTPGMVAVNHSTTFPFGWTSLGVWASENGLNSSDFSAKYFAVTSNGQPKTYVVFPNSALSVKYVSWFIDKYRNRDIGKWFSLDPDDAADYARDVDNWYTKFVV